MWYEFCTEKHLQCKGTFIFAENDLGVLLCLFLPVVLSLLFSWEILPVIFSARKYFSWEQKNTFWNTESEFKKNNGAMRKKVRLQRQQKRAPKLSLPSCISKLLISITAIANKQKQPSRGVLRKICSQNMQQIYRRAPMLKCDFSTPMPKCDFSKATLLKSHFGIDVLL